MNILNLTFNIPLHPGEIPAFRSCIVDIVGKEYEVFHNHDNSGSDTSYLHWGYPLVQYSVRKGLATIIAIEEGAEIIQKVLLPKISSELNFAGKVRPILGLRINGGIHNWKILDHHQQYGLMGWLALNKTNYLEWKTSQTQKSRGEILNRCITGHLRVIGKVLGVEDLNQITGNVLQVDNQKRISWHGTQLVRFNAMIESNLPLPIGINIGRAAAFGFGEVMPVSVYKKITSLRPQPALVEF